MKNLLHGFISLVILPISTCFAQSTGQDFDFERFDTTIFKTWDGTQWVNNSKTFNSFNSDCSINSTIIQLWQNSNWENNVRTTHTYLPSKKENQSFSSFWQDTDWVEFSRTTNTYNQALQLTSELIEVNIGGTWMGQSQNNYTYDANGFVASILTQTWTGTQFQNSNLTNNTNSVAGLVISERTQNWTGTSWVNSDSTHYTYNAQNLILSSISFDWDGMQWVNAERINATYVNDLLVEILSQVWINNAWVNSDRETFTYDNNRRLVTLLDQTWNVPTQNWVNAFLDEFSYTTACGALPLTLLNFDAEVKSGLVLLQWKTTNEINTSGFTIQKSTDGVHFNPIGRVLSTGGKTINNYSFEDPLQIDQPEILYYRLLMEDNDGRSTLSDVEKVEITSLARITLFPNPVKDQLIFVMPKSLLNSDVRIINQHGSVVVSQKFNEIIRGARNTLDVSILPKGVYLIQISDGNKLISKKIIKQ